MKKSSIQSSASATEIDDRYVGMPASLVGTIKENLKRIAEMDVRSEEREQLLLDTERLARNFHDQREAADLARVRASDERAREPKQRAELARVRAETKKTLALIAARDLEIAEIKERTEELRSNLASRQAKLEASPEWSQITARRTEIAQIQSETAKLKSETGVARKQESLLHGLARRLGVNHNL